MIAAVSQFKNSDAEIMRIHQFAQKTDEQRNLTEDRPKDTYEQLNNANKETECISGLLQYYLDVSKNR